jgi:hypothetical protein
VPVRRATSVPGAPRMSRRTPSGVRWRQTSRPVQTSYTDPSPAPGRRW